MKNKEGISETGKKGERGKKKKDFFLQMFDLWIKFLIMN